ncbi:MAG TPA: hypothetical protein VNU26_14750, partial [Mycobacteriales bacterium]|nr:hypothetical protein [Mycobacteriales bacterium]
MSRPVAAALAACAIGVVAACTSTEPPAPVTVVDAAAVRPEPVETHLQSPAQRQSPPGTPRPAWAVDPGSPGLTGRSVAEVRARPALAADRRLPTSDLLPPPADDRFTSSVAPISPEIRARMGESWSERCPVGLVDLRYVTVVFRGFDGRAHTGE